MASQAKTKWAAARAEEEGPPSRKKAQRRDAPPTLGLPSWTPKLLGLTATQGGFEAAVGDTLFLSVLKYWPDSLKVKLLALLQKAPKENKFVATFRDEINELRETLDAEYEASGVVDRHRSVIPRMVAVLAAHLGVVAGPEDPAKLISDGTLLAPDIEGIKLEARALPELCAYTTSPALLTSNGDVRCWCQKPIVLKTRQSWRGLGPALQYFSCATGQCRLHITISAMKTLQTTMEKLGVSRVPMWFCPQHPDREIRISDHDDEETKDKKLKVRCSWYGGDQRDRQFCSSEWAGPDGQVHQATGPVIWRALDLLAA